jgi:hypothetical protein
MFAVLASSSLAQTAATPATADPFARYTTPGQCEQAAERISFEYWRSRRQDTVRYAPATDSIPAVAVQAARTCAARFSVASARERELLDLAQLYLLGQQDSLAQAAINRLLTSQASEPTVQRGWTLQLIANTYLDAKPARLAQAQTYLKQLDDLGAAVSTWRLFAHTSFAKYAMSINDLSAATAQSQAALAAGNQMNDDDRMDWVYALYSAYTALADPVTTQTGKPVPAIIDSMKVRLLSLRPPQSNEQKRLESMINSAEELYSLFGQKSSPLVGKHWFNTNNDTSARPKPGVVSLIVFVNSACSGYCYPTYATLRRVYDKYASRGLHLILVTSTNGYFRNQLQPPNQEADSAIKYFADFLKLPGVIVANETDFTHKADGRRVNTPTDNQRHYYRGRNGILVDKQGLVRLVVSVSPERETTLDSIIEDALH